MPSSLSGPRGKSTAKKVRRLDALALEVQCEGVCDPFWLIEPEFAKCDPIFQLFGGEEVATHEAKAHLWFRRHELNELKCDKS